VFFLFIIFVLGGVGVLGYTRDFGVGFRVLGLGRTIGFRRSCRVGGRVWGGQLAFGDRVAWVDARRLGWQLAFGDRVALGGRAKAGLAIGFRWSCGFGRTMGFIHFFFCS